MLLNCNLFPISTPSFVARLHTNSHTHFFSQAEVKNWYIAYGWEIYCPGKIMNFFSYYLVVYIEIYRCWVWRTIPDCRQVMILMEVKKKSWKTISNFHLSFFHETWWNHNSLIKHSTMCAYKTKNYSFPTPWTSRLIL